MTTAWPPRRDRLVQYAGRVLRQFPGKATAEVHGHHDVTTGVLASSLTERAPGYTSLGFHDPRRSPHARVYRSSGRTRVRKYRVAPRTQR